jgi:hypothetical protein
MQHSVSVDNNITVFLDVMRCDSIVIDVSEQSTATILRALE